MGKAKSLKNRVASYFQNPGGLLPKTKLLVKNIFSLDYILVQSELEALLLEANLIKKYRPKYNVSLKDSGSYPLIKITVNEDYPRVFSTRKIEKDKALYFGPYPDAKSLKYLLRLIRKIFAFCSCKTHPRSCLYHHLGLCPLPVHKIKKRQYKKIIKNIILFLEGKKGRTVEGLQIEMKKSIKNLEFEKSAKLKNQIENIRYFTQKNISPSVYEENPNLLNDLRERELLELQKVLGLKNRLKRLECYDISNLQGSNATGSMAVITNGFLDKSQYRRFKIKSKFTPDDYEMLREVLTRRFKNNWPLPDLLIIDGGAGQLSVLIEVLRKNNLQIPALGLAKKIEEIYFQNGEKVSRLILRTDSPALQILTRLRDEAHRFAKSYHLKLRSNFLLDRCKN